MVDREPLPRCLCAAHSFLEESPGSVLMHFLENGEELIFWNSLNETIYREKHFKQIIVGGGRSEVGKKRQRRYPSLGSHMILI